jgi:hypothetical protein
MANNVKSDSFMMEFAKLLSGNLVLEYLDLRDNQNISQGLLRKFLTALEDRGAPLRIDIDTKNEEITALLDRLAAGALHQDVSSEDSTGQGQSRSSSCDLLADADNEWEIPAYTPIPEIDDSSVLLRFEGEFSIANLVEEIRKI